MTKKQITKQLEEIGAAWAVKAEKYISPNDPGEPWERKPTWHIHPDIMDLNEDHIMRFSTLANIQGWIEWIQHTEYK